REREPRASARADPRAPERRARDPPGGEQDPLAREEADGALAEGVLPQRADAGDPEGARRSRRVQGGDRRDRRGAQEARAPHRGGPHARPEGAQEAADDAADE